MVQGFLVQFGIAADPRVQQQWNARSNIQDDPMIGTHVKRGTLAYAGSGKNSRGTQIWIAFQDSSTTPPPPFSTVNEHAWEANDAALALASRQQTKVQHRYGSTGG